MIQITIGCHVDVNLIDRTGSKDRLSVDIVTDDLADFEQGFLGANTPLAQAMIGEKAGVVIPYMQGDIFAIEVLTVAPSTKTPTEQALKERQARMNETIREVEHTSAVVFASSFSGKWGDYDPDSLPQVDKRQAGGHEDEKPDK